VLRDCVPLVREALAAALLSIAGSASAMNGLLLLDTPPEQGLRWATGLSMWQWRTLPTDVPRQRTWFYPALDVRSADGWFVSTDNGLGWNLSRDPATQAGLRLSPWPSRGGASGHVGKRLEQGLFANHALGPAVLLQSSLRHGAGRGRDGWVGEAGVTSGLPLPGGELLGITLGATWANSGYRSSYDSSGYGGQGARVPGGWQDLQLALSYEHRFDAHWRLDGQWLTARTTGLQRWAEGGNANQRALSLSLWRDMR
jgi:hypothetical protein